MTWSTNQHPAWTVHNRSGGAGRAPAEAAIAALDAYLARLPRQRTARDAAGLVLYLLGWDLVVVPASTPPAPWQCIVLAGSPGHAPGSTVLASDLDLQTALSVGVAPPLADLPAATFAAVWQAKAVVSCPGGHLPALCRALAEDLRQPHSRHVRLDADATQRLVRHTATQLSEVRRLLSGLCDAGLLHAGAGMRGGCSYTLTMPPPDACPHPRIRAAPGGWIPPTPDPFTDTRM